MTKRKIGIDYGEKRIGVAVSDLLGITAKGCDVLYWNGLDVDLTVRNLAKICEKYDPDTIVFGLPSRTDGKISETSEKARHMAKELENFMNVKVVFEDEKYTSVLAGRILRETKKKTDRKSGETDMMAAEIILSSYLEKLRKL